MTEQWLPIPGWEGHYEASNQGRVRSLFRTKAFPEGKKNILKPWVGTTGYFCVTLYNGKSAAKLRLNRLICLTFHGEPPADKPMALHGNGNRQDNHADNLRWGSRSENMLDAVKHGTHFNHLRHRTRCINGHEFTPENTLHKPDGRKCRTCRRDRVRLWRQREKAKAAA